MSKTKTSVEIVKQNYGNAELWVAVVDES